MEITTFMEKFLPYCKDKWFEFYHGDSELEESIEYDGLNFERDRNFIDYYFEEAIQNFADCICEKQRENCNAVFIAAYESDINRENCENMQFAYYKDEIYYAEQPEIDLL